MKRDYPTVPLGALGFTAPFGEPPEPPVAPDRSALTRGEGGRLEPVLGGAEAGRQAARVVRSSIRRGHRLLDLVERQRKIAAYWPRVENEADGFMKDALALSVAPYSDETEDAYEERLTAIFENLRLRLDPIARETVVPLPSASPAPAHVQVDLPNAANQDDLSKPTNGLVTPPTGPSGVNALPPGRVVTVLRREAKKIRREFWARNHRKPTVEEWEALVREGNGNASG